MFTPREDLAAGHFLLFFVCPNVNFLIPADSDDMRHLLGLCCWIKSTANSGDFARCMSSLSLDDLLVETLQITDVGKFRNRCLFSRL